MYTVSIGGQILKYDDGREGGFPLTWTQYYEHYAAKNVTASADLVGGYHSASFEVRVPYDHLDMLLGRLGGDVRLYNRDCVQIWEGFVDKISASLGKATVNVGPMMSVSNRVKLSYKGFRWNTNPPINEGQKETDWIEDATSMTTFGPLEEIVQGGKEMSDEEADIAVAEALKQRAWPKVDRDMSVGGFGVGRPRFVTVRFECLGYYHILNKTYYYDWDNYLTARIRDIIVGIVGPHKLFDLTGVQDIDATMGQYSESEQPSWDALKAYLDLMETDNGYGYSFGVYDERNVELRLLHMPRTPEYYVSARTGLILDVFGSSVVTSIRPGSWIASTSCSMPMYDPRLTCGHWPIKSVEYRADGGITINEVKYSLIGDSLDARGI